MSDVLPITQHQPQPASGMAPLAIPQLLLSFARWFSPILVFYSVILLFVGLVAHDNIPPRYVAIYGAIMAGVSGLFLFSGQLSARTAGTQFVWTCRIFLPTSSMVGTVLGVSYALRGSSHSIPLPYGFLGLILLFPLAGFIVVLDILFVSATADAAGERGGTVCSMVTSAETMKAWIVAIKRCFSQTLPLPTPGQEQSQGQGEGEGEEHASNAAALSSHELESLPGRAQGKVKQWLSRMVYTYSNLQIPRETMSEEKLLLDGVSDESV